MHPRLSVPLAPARRGLVTAIPGARRSAMPRGIAAAGGLTPTVARMTDTAAEIMGEPPDKADFLHAVLCQVGMPRKAINERSFTRRNGAIALEIEAGARDERRP